MTLHFTTIFTEPVATGIPRDLIYSLRSVERPRASLKFFKYIGNTTTLISRRIPREICTT